jgi:preprotein translocase subunit SecG
MTNILLTLHVIIALALIIVILLQRSDGGALGGIGGGVSFGGILSSRGSANFMTRLTAILAAAFIANSLGLAVLESGNKTDESILENINDEEIEAPLIPLNDESSSDPIPPQAE